MIVIIQLSWNVVMAWFRNYIVTLCVWVCLLILAFWVSSSQARDVSRAMTLSEALEAALAQNPVAGAVRAQRQAAEARVGESRSGFFPQILVSSGYTRFKEPNIVVPIHKAGVFPPLDNDIYETILQLNIPLFKGGRTWAAHRAAKAVERESLAQEDLSRIRLIEGVAQIFIRSWTLEDTQTLLKVRLKALKQRHDELITLLNEGRVSPGDLALVRSSIASARADSIAVTSRDYELSVLLGQTMGADGPVEPLGADLLDVKKSVRLSDSVAVVAGPAVRIAQARLERAQALRVQAVRMFWPEVSGFTFYSFRSGDDFKWTGEWAAGVRLQVPLFDGGRRIAGARAAGASVQAAREGERSALQAQEAGLRVAIDRWRSSQIRRDYLVLAAQSKSQSVSAQQALYGTGRISLSELLIQEAELLQMQIEEREATHAEAFAMLSYYATAGRLTVDLARTFLRSSP